MVIVYDMDNTLTNLTDSIFEKLGVDSSLFTNYSIDKCPLTEFQKKSIIREFNNPSAFLNAPFIKGAERIFDVQWWGSSVFIHSLSYQESIRDVKAEQLVKFYGCSVLRKTWLEVGKSKTAYDNVDIVVDDCLDNLLTSKARICNILIDKVYSREAIKSIDLRKHKIFVASCLENAVNHVERIVKSSMKVQNCQGV